jgi:hypothetical protein
MKELIQRILFGITEPIGDDASEPMGLRKVEGEYLNRKNQTEVIPFNFQL